MKLKLCVVIICSSVLYLDLSAQPLINGNRPKAGQSIIQISQNLKFDGSKKVKISSNSNERFSTGLNETQRLFAQYGLSENACILANIPIGFAATTDERTEVGTIQDASFFLSFKNLSINKFNWRFTASNAIGFQLEEESKEYSDKALESQGLALLFTKMYHFSIGKDLLFTAITNYGYRPDDSDFIGGSFAFSKLFKFIRSEVWINGQMDKRSKESGSNNSRGKWDIDTGLDIYTCISPVYSLIGGILNPFNLSSNNKGLRYRLGFRAQL